MPKPIDLKFVIITDGYENSSKEYSLKQVRKMVDGVVETEVGDANDKTDNPSHEDVCCRDTGHAEAVRVVYDSSIVGLGFLIELFFDIIDPTTLNRQGNDVGKQYRTGIYYVFDDGPKDDMEDRGYGHYIKNNKTYLFWNVVMNLIINTLSYSSHICQFPIRVKS